MVAEVNRTVRSWLRCLGLVLLMAPLLLGALAARAATDAATPSMDNLASNALRWGDFDELERLYAVAKASGRRQATGNNPIELFLKGVARVMNNSDVDGDAYIIQVEALTRKWVSERPTSVLAQLLLIRALHARAWVYRGGDYADKVSPQAMADFQKYNALAGKQLADHSALLMSDTTAHLYLLMVARSGGLRKDAQFAIAQDGLRKNPEEDAIYVELLTSMLPKWGGSADDMEAVAQMAMTEGKARGKELYALVYETVAWEFEAGTFEKTRADWPTMKQGMRDLLARLPDPVNLNRFAKLACIAQDKATAAELLGKIGDSPVLERWGGGSNGRRNFDACRRWLRQNG